MNKYFPSNTLNGPSSSISQGTDCMSFDLLSKFFKHINFSEVSLSDLHSFKDINKPASSFSTECTKKKWILPAWCALSTGFVLVEFGESQDGINHISRFIHNNNSSSTKTTSFFLQGIEVHPIRIRTIKRDTLQNIVTNSLGENRDGGTSWNNSLKIIPTTSDTTTVSFNKFSKRNTHFFFDSTRIVDVT